MWVKEGEEPDREKLRELCWRRLALGSCLKAVGGGADLLVDRADPQDELKDYEKLAETGEAFVFVAMSRLMARWLARS